ncbi:MAG: hypothetical protein LBT50_09310, partial [Prevotellaceae bacterium]|nr:hypothetical protein [Prevotellaceae bacterium]
DANKRLAFVFPQIAESDFKIMYYHNLKISLFNNLKIADCSNLTAKFRRKVLKFPLFSIIILLFIIH